MRDAPKVVWSIPYVSVAFHPILKRNYIAYRSSKVSDCIFEIHQLWQSGFSRVYSNSRCTSSFEPEIINMGQSSHNMYNHNILNCQESPTILNAHTIKFWPLPKESLPELPYILNIATLTLTLWPINSGVLTYLLLPHLSLSLTYSLPSLKLLCHSKTDVRFMQDRPKAVHTFLRHFFQV